ncbi:site-2 protease family protein [Waterburya agarophytonicola K14]|uniref:Site-2 protease family protein n=1 Tax=Waterburya agarophytonicola KI4 TaxID=2874699 RepID=A0A964FGD7_9CYAN|nr:site-2 protease family protein [Waterburya agarophytonicola]MCC0177881.1 site-2 protease family protein [Waterburya agarophytonicola KI4]
MLNGSESLATFILLTAVIAILFWGYNRAKAFGRLGILAWLQSIALMSPWLLFFGLFTVGIYLNLVGILFLLLASIAVYIWLGKQLRAEGQEALLQQKAAERIKKEAEISETLPPIVDSDELNNDIASEVLPIPQEDLADLKGIFGIDTFFATETIPYQDGAIFKGNLRGEAEMAYSKMSQKLTATFDDKYRLFLVESPEARPVVVILPKTNDPQTTTLPQKNLALILFIGTILTSLEASSLLQGFDLFSDFGRYSEAVPLSLGLWAVLIAHEIGHRIVANHYKIRLSIPFFLPSWQIGSFGTITRFESLLPNRTALFDIAFAGPAAAGIISLILLVTGLTISHPGSMFQLPTEFFRASILVGTLAKVILGSALETAVVDINPLVIIGWLGLVITALNLLPAGKLDGGRIVHAIYGRKTGRRSTLATLIILGIVALFNPVNPIPLYWAVLILFLQRDLERPVQNELTEPDDSRAAWALLALFLSLATLIPLSASLAGRIGLGS